MCIRDRRGANTLTYDTYGTVIGLVVSKYQRTAIVKPDDGANTVWYSSKFPLLYSLYVRSYTGTALGPQSGVLVAPFNIRGAKPKFPGRMQNFKALLLARVRVLRRKSFPSQKGSTAGLKTHGDQGQNAKGRF